MKSARGVTLTDLCIVMAMLLFLVGAVLPLVTARSREAANRIKCSNNLRQIGLAMKMYANEEPVHYAYPRTKYAPNQPPVWGTGGGHQPTANANPFNPEGVSGGTADNDVTAAMFLLLRTQDITTDVFICPSSQNDRYIIQSRQTIQNYTNWANGDGENTVRAALSYSYQNPYPTDNAVAKGFLFNDSMNADFAIAADLNSGAPALLTTSPASPAALLRAINSPNHDYDGQNVLYADGHTDWATSPFVGIANDNIYTAGPNPAAAHPGMADPVVIAGSPIGANDSILLPTWDASTPLAAVPPPPPDWETRLILLAGILLLVLMVAGGITAFFIFRKKPTPDVPS